jgi:hypothetical protein
MQRTLKTPTVKVVQYMATVGPRHDPYGRTITDITLRDRKFSIIECGLAGLVFSTEDSSIGEGRDDCDIEKIIEAETGMSLRWWTDRVFSRAEQARERGMTSEQYESYLALMEADAFLLRCAN